MAEKIKGISIDDQEKSLIEAFGVNTEELNDRFQKFMRDEFNEILKRNRGKDSLEVNPIEVTKSYLKEFTLQEIGAMAAAGMFERFDNFVKLNLQYINQNIEDDLKIDFDMSLS